MKSRIGSLSVGTALSLLAGCTVGPNYEAAKPWFSPSSWFADRTAPSVPSEPVAAPIDPNWWAEFKDPELTALESRVAASNLSVRLAAIRLGESRAQLGIARADEMPTLDANGSYTRERLSQKGVIGLLGVGQARAVGALGAAIRAGALQARGARQAASPVLRGLSQVR